MNESPLLWDLYQSFWGVTNLIAFLKKEQKLCRERIEHIYEWIFIHKYVSHKLNNFLKILALSHLKIILGFIQIVIWRGGYHSKQTREKGSKRNIFLAVLFIRSEIRKEFKQVNATFLVLL